MSIMKLQMMQWFHEYNETTKQCNGFMSIMKLQTMQWFHKYNETTNNAMVS